MNAQSRYEDNQSAISQLCVLNPRAGVLCLQLGPKRMIIVTTIVIGYIGNECMLRVVVREGESGGKASVLMMKYVF